MAENHQDGLVRELNIALDNRAFELQLFWQRSNYFIVLMTALGVGVFAIQDILFSFIISFFSAIISWFWYRTNLGSKFWHESWEVEVHELSKELNVRSFIKSTNDIVRQVTGSLKSARKLPINSSFLGKFFVSVRRYIDRQTIQKPSVSYNMILLSLASVFFWIFVASVFAFRIAFSTPAFPESQVTSPPELERPLGNGEESSVPDVQQVPAPEAQQSHIEDLPSPSNQATSPEGK